jgi:hypothetical protein
MKDNAVVDKTRQPTGRPGAGAGTDHRDGRCDPSGIAAYSQVGAQFGYGWPGRRHQGGCRLPAR